MLEWLTGHTEPKTEDTTPDISNGSDTLERLSKISEDNTYDPETHFNWGEHISPESTLMPPEMVTIFGTDFYNNLSEEQKIKLGRFELANFFSQTAFEESTIDRAMRPYMKEGFSDTHQKYFEHFFEEEEKHQYFFYRFSRDHVGKVYDFGNVDDIDIIDNKNILGFKKARYEAFLYTLVAEKVADYYNVKMMNDDRLPPLLQHINKQHHIDESRHMSMGKLLAETLWLDIKEHEATKEHADEMQENLEKFIQTCMLDYCNPEVFEDAGITDLDGAMQAFLDSEERINFERTVCKNIVDFLYQKGIIKNPDPILDSKTLREEIIRKKFEDFKRKKAAKKIAKFMKSTIKSKHTMVADKQKKATSKRTRVSKSM